MGYDGSGSEGSAEETFLKSIQSDLSKLKLDRSADTFKIVKEKQCEIERH